MYYVRYSASHIYNTCIYAYVSIIRCVCTRTRAYTYNLEAVRENTALSRVWIWTCVPECVHQCADTLIQWTCPVERPSPTTMHYESTSMGGRCLCNTYRYSLDAYPVICKFKSTLHTLPSLFVTILLLEIRIRLCIPNFLISPFLQGMYVSNGRTPR